MFYLSIIGAILPVLVYLLKRRYPGSFWKSVSVPLLLGGLNYMPPASGMNYGSWAVVGLIFGYFVRKRYNGWWRRYNFILSSSLETSVSLAGVVIFFAVYYPGVSDRVAWWGTDVYKVPPLSVSFHERKIIDSFDRRLVTGWDARICRFSRARRFHKHALLTVVPRLTTAWWNVISGSSEAHSSCEAHERREVASTGCSDFLAPRFLVLSTSCKIANCHRRIYQTVYPYILVEVLQTRLQDVEKSGLPPSRTSPPVKPGCLVSGAATLPSIQIGLVKQSLHLTLGLHTG